MFSPQKCDIPYPKINQDNKLMNWWGGGGGRGGGYHQLNSRNFYILSKSCNFAVLIWNVVLFSLSLKLVHLDFPHHDTTINHIT